MDFDDDAKLDTSQVRDLRGRRTVPKGGAALAGGGLVGIIALVIALLAGGGGDGGGTGGDAISDILAGLQGQQAGGAVDDGTPSEVETSCETGADAQERADCRIVGVVNSVQAYWAAEFERSGQRYEPSITTFFEGVIDTGCGRADSSVGPFYCPADQGVYLDLGFYDVLRDQLGAQGGPFAEAYVIAHEYGHHVSNLLGVNSQVGRETGPQSSGVRLELQADCFAGVWARNAVDTGFYDRPFSDAEIRDGLDAAATVGDDRIQSATQGRVQPESWTHGSAEQRQRWFLTGYESGDPNTCDTFGIATV